MNQSKHTPAPWRATKAGATILDNEGVAIAHVFTRVGRIANASLIAAAPDLLAACERAVAAAEKPDDFIEGAAAYEALRAVIAQAREEEQ